ncbi:MAG: hypothetical protein ACRCW9_05870 [Cetobacterium sp.]
MNEIYLVGSKIIEFIPYEPSFFATNCNCCLLVKSSCANIDLKINDQADNVCSFLEYMNLRVITDPKKILELKILGLERMKFLDIETKKDLTEEILELILKGKDERNN